VLVQTHINPDVSSAPELVSSLSFLLYYFETKLSEQFFFSVTTYSRYLRAGDGNVAFCSDNFQHFLQVSSTTRFNPQNLSPSSCYQSVSYYKCVLCKQLFNMCSDMIKSCNKKSTRPKRLILCMYGACRPIPILTSPPPPSS
jgi:hypothetical protein